jgi:hypothetical protein
MTSPPTAAVYVGSLCAHGSMAKRIKTCQDVRQIPGVPPGASSMAMTRPRGVIMSREKEGLMTVLCR